PDRSEMRSPSVGTRAGAATSRTAPVPRGRACAPSRCWGDTAAVEGDTALFAVAPPREAWRSPSSARAGARRRGGDVVPRCERRAKAPDALRPNHPVLQALLG